MAKKVWVVSDSEPIPQLTGTGRLMRAGMFAEYMADEEADVTWWASTWLHWEERFYSDKPVTEKIRENLTVKLLHAGKAYKKHISPSRIAYCLRIANEFRKAVKTAEKPDVIICSWPLMSLGYLCVKYGKKNGIPVTLDIRDLWPDIFVQPFHGILKKAVQLFVNVVIDPWVSYAMKNADRVIGVTRDAVQMAYDHGRVKNSKDELIPLCYKEKNYTAEELRPSNDLWRSLGIGESDFLVIFIGSIQLRIAKLDVVIEAARKIKHSDVKFVFCGGGSDVELLKQQAEGLENVIFPGYVNAKDLYALGHMSKIGLLPYANTPDFINSLPNKLGEYLSYGLYVMTALRGDSRALLQKYDCGNYYEDSEDLKDKLNTIYGSIQVFPEMRRKALRLYGELFNADEVYSKLCKDLIKIQEK